MHLGVEVTESSTNKQHHLSLLHWHRTDAPQCAFYVTAFFSFSVSFSLYLYVCVCMHVHMCVCIMYISMNPCKHVHVHFSMHVCMNRHYERAHRFTPISLSEACSSAAIPIDQVAVFALFVDSELPVSAGRNARVRRGRAAPGASKPAFDCASC